MHPSLLLLAMRRIIHAKTRECLRENLPQGLAIFRREVLKLVILVFAADDFGHPAEDVVLRFRGKCREAWRVDQVTARILEHPAGQIQFAKRSSQYRAVCHHNIGSMHLA